MRLFIAIEFSNIIKEYIHSIQQILKEHSVSGNYTDIDNYHMTLVFIGEIEPCKLDILKSILDSFKSKYGSFNLYLDKPGYFDRKNKKLIWLGMRGEKTIFKIVSDLQKQLCEHGFIKEINYSYRPHITIAREIVFKDELEKAFPDIIVEEKKVDVKTISLVESKRLKGKQVYNTIYSVEL